MIQLPDNILLRYILGYLLLAFVAAFVVELLAWLTQRGIRAKMSFNRTVIAEYDAPKHLSACEIGYLVDHRFGDNELRAALVTMAQKGLVTIDTSPADWVINRKANISSKVLVEQIVLDSLRSEQRWSDISSTLSKDRGLQNNFEAAVLGDLASKDYVRANGAAELDNAQRLVIVVATFLVMLGTLLIPLQVMHLTAGSSSLDSGFAAIDGVGVNILLLPLYLIVWVALFRYTKYLVRHYFSQSGIPFGATPKLKQLLPEIYGFQEFIMTVETPRYRQAEAVSNAAAPFVEAFHHEI